MIVPGWRAWLFSLRCFAAAVIAMYIAFSADLPRPYWAMASVYVASQPLSGATRSKALYRLLGTLLGATVSVALVPNLVDTPVLLSLGLAGWIAICVVLGVLDRTPRSYVFMSAGFSAAVISFPLVDTPDQIFDIAIVRVQEICLGIICATMVHSLVLPTPAGPVVAARIVESLRIAQRWAANALAGQIDAEDVRRNRGRIAAVATELDQLDSFLAWDPTQRVSAGQSVQQFRWRLLLLLPIIASIRDRVNALRVIAPLSPGLDQLLRDIRQWLGSSDHAALATEGAALRERIDTVEAGLEPGADWRRILTASLLLRLRDLTQLWQDGKQIERQVREPDRFRAVMLYPSDAEAGTVRQLDYGMAVWSGLAAALAVLVCCALWILGRWDDGGVAAEIVAVTCSFFAAQDNPVPFMVGFLRATTLALLLDGVLLFGVLPMVHDFPILVLVFAPPYLLGGVLMATPPTAAMGTALMVLGPTLLSLGTNYDADFPTFVNAGIAALFGMAIAAVVTAITRSVGAEWSARRLLRQAWRALEQAALRRGQNDRSQFAARMLDRLSQLMPRLASADAENDTAASTLMADLRIGLNIVDLRRARHELPQTARGAIDAMLDCLAAFFHQRLAGQKPDAVKLLGGIDTALAQVAALPDGDGRRDALLGLVGIRATLYPTSPYTPPPQPLPAAPATEAVS